MVQKEGFLGGRNNFKTSLTLSVVALTLIFLFLAYQILKLQNTGAAVVSNTDDSEIIYKIITNTNALKDAFTSNSLKPSILETTLDENRQLLKKIETESSTFLNYKSKSKSNYVKLQNYYPNKLNAFKAELQNIQNLNIEFKKWNTEVVTKSKKAFTQHNSQFPKIFLISTIIGFTIVSLALVKIFDAQRLINEKSSILDSILENTNDVANFYAPVYDQDNNLVDFEISYASKANITLTNVAYQTMVGRLVSETYPFLKISGVFDQLIASYKNQQYFEKTLEIPIDGKTRYFKSRYIPVKTGLQVMVTELTSLFSKQAELEEINNKLSIKNKLFYEAEAVAEFGSFVWFIEQNRSEMSDNVYRILGHDPQELSLTASKLRNFVHKDDLEKYDENLKNTFKQNELLEFYFRIITKNNTVKYLHIKGNYSERNGESIIVGVLQDVTNRVSNENKLMKQNIELTSRNAQLDSFNHVVSHDLQEPLRKIQMFVSRINDEEEENLTQKSQQYFKKIEDAASRMRKLINNLLAYSRIDSRDYDFELVDLNEILTHVLDTFSESKNHENVDIEISEMPSLHAIPFLMEQLFTNIIGNAIKYKETTRFSKIKIQSNKLHFKQIPQDFIKTHTYYHEIKITDNGIGFNQTDSEKIFELFQRLHSKSQYSGTGLGLAICKKIVLKHFGFIHANSVLDSGSVFTVYLPSGNLINPSVQNSLS